MATWKSTYGNPDWYRQQIPAAHAQQQADRLGISTDQLFNLYVETNKQGPYGTGLDPRTAQQPTPPQGGFQGWSGSQGQGSGQVINAPPDSSSAITGIYGPLAAWNKVTGGGQQGPPLAPPAPTGATIMNPLQLPSQQAGVGNLLGSRPSGSIPPPNPTAAAGLPSNLPGISGGPPTFGTTPVAPPAVALPSSNVLNPIPVQLQPVQQYQRGGLVTSGNQNQSSDPNPPYFDPTTGTYYQSTSYGRGSPLSTPYAQNNALYATNAQGLLTGNPVTYANATDLAGMLGAAALNSPMVINQAPSSALNAKSGVAQVGGALISGGVPTVPQGPWLTNPSVFARATPYAPTAAPTVTPQTPATAVPYTPGTAFATPPAAPGYTLGSTLPPAMAQSGAAIATPPAAMLPPGFTGGAQGAGYVPQAFLQAHSSALADAGKALYSHFGGDPNSASPADIANFHTQLTGAVGQHIAGTGAGAGNLVGSRPSGSIPPPNPMAATGLPANLPGISGGPPTFGTAPVAPPPIAPPKRGATGGLVPGRGSDDTVPALLTPGEYVIPKEQVAQLVARGALKMQSGGVVPDPDPDPSEPPEARRQALTSSQPSSSSVQRSSLQVPAGSNLASGLSQAAQAYGSSMGGGGGIPRGSTAGAGAYGTVGDFMAGQGSAGAAGSLGKLGGLSSPGAQSALGGIGSGLTQAAQAIASSAQPWQVQPSAIPDPSQLPQYQIPTLKPVRVT